MHIALCDNDEQFILFFARKLDQGYRSKGMQVSIKVFSSGTDLLASDFPYDFVYLDIEMPAMDGLQIASIINAERKAGIIFVSRHENMVFEIFDYHPFWFLRKSRIDTDLDAIIDRTITVNRLKVKDIEFYTLEGETIIGVLKNIIYFEVHNHTLSVYMEHGDTINVSSSLKKYEEMLKDDGFVRVHERYLVNCGYIRKINLENLVLKNEQTIKMSKYRKGDVKTAFHEYVRRFV